MNSEKETPTKQNLSLTRTPITRPRPQHQHSTLQPSEPATIKHETPSSHQLPTPTTTGTRTRIPIFPKPRPARAPLRSRPIIQLAASDFKPNPKHNQGLSYAFSETVRDRAARRCLPGCTKPSCCGAAFRAMVEAGARPTLPKGLFEDTQDDSEEAEEERLLRHYLGGAYREGMQGKEREDVLLRARTELLANQHGKHRQAFERKSSPEGFWDTEMPSTQRIEEIRAESERRERVVVEERWREAMREDGRWVFRDE